MGGDRQDDGQAGDPRRFGCAGIPQRIIGLGGGAWGSTKAASWRREGLSTVVRLRCVTQSRQADITPVIHVLGKGSTGQNQARRPTTRLVPSGLLAGRLHIVGGVAEPPLVGDADIGGELALDLVAQPQAELAARQARAGAARAGCPGPTGSAPRAAAAPAAGPAGGHKSRCQPAKHVALVGEEGRPSSLEPVGQQGLEPGAPDRCAPLGLDVLAQAELQVGVAADRARIEGLDLRRLGLASQAPSPSVFTTKRSKSPPKAAWASQR